MDILDEGISTSINHSLPKMLCLLKNDDQEEVKSREHSISQNKINSIFKILHMIQLTRKNKPVSQQIDHFMSGPSLNVSSSEKAYFCIFMTHHQHLLRQNQITRRSFQSHLKDSSDVSNNEILKLCNCLV